MKARLASTCPHCRKAIAVGATITNHGGKWMHDYCAINAENIRKINEGETFRSQAASTYRRKPQRREGRTS
jgi:hypothetical protein